MMYSDGRPGARTCGANQRSRQLEETSTFRLHVTHLGLPTTELDRNKIYEIIERVAVLLTSWQHHMCAQQAATRHLDGRMAC